MILGIGTDMVDIRRIEALTERFGERFLRRILVLSEQARYHELEAARRAGWLAKRFAAKEAAAKALGCGIGGEASFQDIAIGRTSMGQPWLKFRGDALIRLEALCPRGLTARPHVSLSDEPPHAFAFVMLEAV